MLTCCSRESLRRKHCTPQRKTCCVGNGVVIRDGFWVWLATTPYVRSWAIIHVLGSAVYPIEVNAALRSRENSKAQHSAGRCGADVQNEQSPPHVSASCQFRQARATGGGGGTVR